MRFEKRNVVLRVEAETAINQRMNEIMYYSLGTLVCLLFFALSLAVLAHALELLDWTDYEGAALLKAKYIDDFLDGETQEGVQISVSALQPTSTCERRVQVVRKRIIFGAPTFAKAC